MEICACGAYAFILYVYILRIEIFSIKEKAGIDRLMFLIFYAI